MSEVRIGGGILTWNSPERRTGRYGFVALDGVDFADRCSAPVSYDRAAVLALLGRRVRLTARVVEARESGHAGDRFLNVFPTTPAVGSRVEVGVGVLVETPAEWASSEYAVGLQPGDGRAELWLDPRVLYRLHDQTVELFAEETDSPDHPDPRAFLTAAPAGTISNGDGTFQVRTGLGVDAAGVQIHSEVKHEGGGLFSVRPPASVGNAGARIPSDFIGKKPV